MAQLLPANRIEVFDVTVAAGVTATAPTETATAFASGIVTRVEITIPNGHAGLTGIRLAVAHGVVIPNNTGAWIVGNATELGYDLVGQLDSGAWSAFTYNTDVYAHTFHVRFAVLDEYLLETPTAPAPVVTPVLV